MALTYTLELEAKIQPTELLSFINQFSGIPYVNDHQLSDQLSELLVIAYRNEDEDNLIKDEFGFSPTVTLNFRHGKREHARNDELMLKIVANVLKEFDGDMVLEYQSPSVVIQRIKGRITFNSDWHELSGINQLKEAGLDYGFAKLKSHY